MRVPGILVGLVLLGLAAWRSAASGDGSGPQETGGVTPLGLVAPPSDRRDVARPLEAPEGTAAPDVRQLQVQLRVAKARHALGRSYERAASRGDFALAPGRILKSLLERRCGLVHGHGEALLAERERLGLQATEGAGLCRELLFSLLKERLALPEGTSQARFWEMLEQVDAAYERLVLAEPAVASSEAFRAATERFREARRGIVGPEIDRRLFGLADDVLALPFQVDDLLRDPRTPTQEKLAAYEGMLQRIEREHGVRLASVVEPVELAKHALRLHETAGPLGPEQQQAVLERYAGPDVSRRYLEHQQEERDRSERLGAFNQERDRLLEELGRAGLTPEQRQQRMAEIDQQLFKKYRLQ